MRISSLIGCIFIFVISCRKDKGVLSTSNAVSICTNDKYEQLTNGGYDFVRKDLLSNSVFGSTFFRQVPILFTNPCFNPLNDYEICYIKDLNNNSTGKELWKFNFCKGEKTKITSNIFYSLDWSTKNWIIFTGSDNHIYKVKPNGDSLIKLTKSGGVHGVGKWSPDGTKFWYLDGGTTYFICDEYGLVLKSFSSNVIPIDWINSDSLLVNSNQKFCYYSYTTGAISVPLHSSTFNFYAFNSFNIKENTCLVSNDLGQNQNPKFLLRYDFGKNKVDTLKKLFYSYQYFAGDFNSKSNKVIMELRRADWKDSTKDWIQYRNNIIIMNADGTDERMLNLD